MESSFDNFFGDYLLSILITVIILGIVPATIAKNKGYNFILWWIYGAFLLVFAFIHALSLKPKPEIERQLKLAAGGKKCPYCAEIIKAEATICRFCQKTQPAQPVGEEPENEPLAGLNVLDIMNIEKIIANKGE